MMESTSNMDGSRLFPPADDLKPFVRGYFARDARLNDKPVSTNRFPAVVYPSLNVVLCGTIRWEDPQGSLHSLPNAFFSGAFTHPVASVHMGAVAAVSFLFYPGVLPRLCSERPADLVDVLITADALWPRETAALVSRTQGMPVAQAVPFIEDFIRALVGRPPRSVAFEDGQAAGIAQALFRQPLDEVVDRSGLSLRQFERRFLAQYGISPKLFQRLRRFERAVYLLHETRRRAGGTLAQLAAECGYFDQSHFIKDFRRFSGVSPTALLHSVESEEDDYWSYRIKVPRTD